MILLSGENTPLGSHLLPVLRGSHSVCSFGPDKGDIADPVFLEKIILQIAPKIMINTEQFCDPQKAEVMREESYRINSYAPGIIAALCKKYNIFLVHMSSAFVYPPLGKVHHCEDEIPEPSSVYADSLIYGEKKIIESGCRYCILRPTPMFGRNDNFIMHYLKLFEEQQRVAIIKDQHIMPLYLKDAADAIAQIVSRSIEGIYNLSGPDECTFYEFIFRFTDLYQKIRRIDLSPVIDEIPYEEFESTTDLPLHQLVNREKLSHKIETEFHSIESGLSELIHTSFN